jgi:uncharacterized Ntn-hydrolase superfamily protein
MTFSIAARCARTGQVGVAAVTAMPGVGKLVSHAAPDAGAVASQAMINPYLGFEGLRLLGQGFAAQDTLDQLIARDPGAELRQVGIADAAGGVAAYTGSSTPEWSGDLSGDGFVTQGNRLVGPHTLDAIAEAYTRHDDLDLAERMMVALEAGEATGADKDGAVSGTVYVMDTEDYPLWDLRVDSAQDPVKALRALYDEFLDSLVPIIKRMARRDDWLGEVDREALEQ